MKTKRKGQTGLSIPRMGLVCTTVLSACLADAPLAAAEAEEEKKPNDLAPPHEQSGDTVTNYNNWIDLSVGGLIREGNRSPLRHRASLRDGAFGGIEDFHWETAIGEKDFFQIDGRAIFNEYDYGVRLELVRADVGFVRGGYKQFRSWYDGSGGFYPPTAYWLNLYDTSLALDRGEAWFEAGLTLENAPSLTFRYSHQFRDGQTDSTAWGFTHPSGVPTVVRAISPAFWDINEKRDIFAGDLKHTVNKTDLGVGLRYETWENDDARKMRQWPNEPDDRHITQREETQSDLLNVRAFTETRFSEKAFFSTGFSFTKLDSDITGSRIYGDDYDVGYNPALAQALGFIDLSGGTQTREYVVNLNLLLRPTEVVSLVPSARIRKADMDGFSQFIQTGAILQPDTPLSASSERNFLDVNERLELRYGGLTNWVFYARGDWEQGEGDLSEEGGAGLGPPVMRYTEDTRFTQRYTVGANWYFSRQINVDAQYYHKARDYEYDHQVDNTPNNSFDRYPAYLVGQDFRTDDVGVRLTLRPHRRVSLVTRYDFQFSTIDVAPDPVSGLAELQTGKVTSQIIAQNITWIPWAPLYLQVGFNYVLSDTDTPADEVTQAIIDSQNNYWNLTFSSGLALNRKTDLQLNYFYYQADDYEDISQYGVPYGVGDREHGVTVSLIRRIRTNLRVLMRYGFFAYRDAATGGNRDYDAHLIYSSLQYRF
jgi:hypothetical protein